MGHVFQPDSLAHQWLERQHPAPTSQALRRTIGNAPDPFLEQKKTAMGTNLTDQF